MSTAATLYCSFCGKSEHEVAKLIAGPDCFICNECVDLCNDVIREESRGKRVMTAADIGLLEPELDARIAAAVARYPSGALAHMDFDYGGRQYRMPLDAQSIRAIVACGGEDQLADWISAFRKDAA